ncbi:MULTISPECIES: hypothetical protein [Leptolyngbya]|uniref:hypothetical protein n=1 Tax=Leptolyngbya TaxID=47251 RepID=UPI0012B5EAD2|nr:MULTISPECIES: hypothetical protein [Leptolyngbya]MBD2369581.1 hypothetical protein [Leptolyngbya sp. FACHB-161]MBD2375974.1 hypothetical protein [Leptolyngbya sp. FACHB-238]MBD2400250.1 hypothetical protein [Leptolyngbya sp. FACHB-239]MBD2406792.1 hypothetical protein [Leptolyngbya sp. FACHB-402]ULP33683.1 hypothetical protein MCP04_33480 [Leptolyngbya boryana IU 594]
MPQNTVSCQAWVRKFRISKPPTVEEPDFLQQQRNSRSLNGAFLREMVKQTPTECLM